MENLIWRKCTVTQVTIGKILNLQAILDNHSVIFTRWATKKHGLEIYIGVAKLEETLLRKLNDYNTYPSPFRYKHLENATILLVCNVNFETLKLKDPIDVVQLNKRDDGLVIVNVKYSVLPFLVNYLAIYKGYNLNQIHVIKNPYEAPNNFSKIYIRPFQNTNECVDGFTIANINCLYRTFSNYTHDEILHYLKSYEFSVGPFSWRLNIYDPISFVKNNTRFVESGKFLYNKKYVSIVVDNCSISNFYMMGYSNEYFRNPNPFVQNQLQLQSSYVPTPEQQLCLKTVHENIFDPLFIFQLTTLLVRYHNNYELTRYFQTNVNQTFRGNVFANLENCKVYPISFEYEADSYNSNCVNPVGDIINAIEEQSGCWENVFVALENGIETNYLARRIWSLLRNFYSKAELDDFKRDEFQQFFQKRELPQRSEEKIIEMKLEMLNQFN